MRAWLRERWRSVLVGVAFVLAALAGAVALALGRKDSRDPLTKAEGDSNTLRARAEGLEREAELLQEQRGTIHEAIEESEEASGRTRDEIQGESMSELAERWKR